MKSMEYNKELLITFIEFYNKLKKYSWNLHISW